MPSLTLYGLFEVFGRISTHTWNCFFDVEDTQKLNYKFEYNDKVFNNPSEIELKRYTLKPVIGTLMINNKILTNTKIEFYKINQSTGLHGKVLVDTCITDSAGKYYAYIQPGTYNIKIYTGNSFFEQHNVQIQDGLKCYRNIIVTGDISKKHQDIIEFFNTPYVYVFGKIVSNVNKPIPDAELIIIKDKEPIIYIKTNKDGIYNFSLPYGEYIVKLRGPGIPCKSHLVTIDENHGFSDNLSNSSIIFRQNELLLM